MLPHGTRFVDSLRHMVLNFRQGKSGTNAEDETIPSTPSPTTSFSEASTTTIASKKKKSFDAAHNAIEPGPTTSAPTARRKSGMLFSKLMKSGSVDIASASNRSSLGSGPPSAPAVPLSDAALSRENSEKRKKSTSNTRKASKAMRRRISAARLALRKISHSNRAGSGSGLDAGGYAYSSADERSPPPHKRSNPDFAKFLRSPGSLLRKSSSSCSKKKLGPSLSWDPEHRARTPSTSSRSRIHSDGSDNVNGRVRESSVTSASAAEQLAKASSSNASTSGNKCYHIDDDHDGGDRLELAATCLHCSLSVEYKRNIFRNEIESAVKRLARRLGNRPSNSWPRGDDGTGSTSSAKSVPKADASPSRNLGTPDIVVSSISSDEETESGFGRQTSSERGSSLCTSDTSFSTTSPSPRCSTGGIENIFFTEPAAAPGTPVINLYDDATSSEFSIVETADEIDFVPLRSGRRGAVGDLPNIAGVLLASASGTDPTKSTASTKTNGSTEASGSSGEHKPLQAMDTLKPPSYHNAPVEGDSNNSPPRSNSIDLSTLRRDIELWSISSGDVSEIGSDNEYEPATPAESVRTVRSRSHDPTQSPDHILRRSSKIEHFSEIFRKALAKSPVVKRAAAMQEQEQRRVSKHRTSRYWLDEQLNPAEHIWLPSSGPGSASSSTDTECYLGEKDCEKVGEKRRCAACHIVAHTACFPLLSKLNLTCKTTFRDTTVKRNPSKDSWEALTKHHWVHRWKLEGRCQQCSKSFQQKMFRDKEVIAITCSWCKASYHNKRSCFSLHRFEEKCDRGLLRDMILPPSWLLRLPNTRRRHHKHAIAGTEKKKQTKRKYRPFVVKPMDQSIIGPTVPLLVFVNPKSGGNKGSKALHTLCWLLNPRQVFDITAMKGPKYGLEMFRKVGAQLRILVCGGDGTVGWLLSTLDQLNWAAYPPIALMPLGTGNDLSRCMGWGGVFSDEPLAEMLTAVLYETSVTYLDRWRIDVQPNTASPMEPPGDELNDAVQSALPLTVMNNYFSIGADAHVALQFHHSRSANPSMLNSRLKNRIAYGGLGTIDLFKRTWKDLSEYISIEADGVDITSKIREFKFHCVLFHNITFYAGGTIPWGSDNSDEYNKPSPCDGKIEVLGFTTATLAALQMGGRGERIAQCSRVHIVSHKPIPMQVDGEPCLLAPSFININFHSKVPMLRRDKKLLSTPGLGRKATKRERTPDTHNTSIFVHLPVIVVGRHDYDTYRDSLDRLKDTGFEIGSISVEMETELVQARLLIQKLLAEHQMLPYEPGKDWRFLDYISNCEEGIFRMSRHQEHNHAVSDVCNIDDCIILQDDAFPSMTARSAAIGHDLIFAPANASTSTPPPSTIPSDPSQSASTSGVSSAMTTPSNEYPLTCVASTSAVTTTFDESDDPDPPLPSNGAAALTDSDIANLFGSCSNDPVAARKSRKKSRIFGMLCR
uniref:Diacylglycerol kinase n=1 Tax=Panagrellus redivivus TaxID=6233 RepID=A0A7E4V577_PANRE